MTKKYHPDINPDGKEKYDAVLKAFEILKNPRKKWEYDLKTFK